MSADPRCTCGDLRYIYHDHMGGCPAAPASETTDAEPMRWGERLRATRAMPSIAAYDALASAAIEAVLSVPLASETTDAGLTAEELADLNVLWLRAAPGQRSLVAGAWLEAALSSSGSIDPERLARAIADGAPLDEKDEWYDSPRVFAADIAIEYDRLTREAAP